MALQNEDVLLKLPHGMKMRDVRWLSIWCRRFTVNYGDVYLPRGIQIPRPEASLFKTRSLTWMGQDSVTLQHVHLSVFLYVCSKFNSIKIST